MQLRVLGPIYATREGETLELGAPKWRALLCALALSGGRPVSVDTLLDLLWGEAPPPVALTTLQSYVSGLRKVLEPDRARRAPASLLVTVAPGYALKMPAAAVDANRFVAVVNEEHRRLSGPVLGSSRSREELEESLRRLDGALALWRGEAYAELGDAPAAAAERSHLDELRVVAQEDRAAARLLLGDHAPVAAELEQLTAVHPLRERLWALRALALVRSGRQADALDIVRQVREVLSVELGLDPGAELRDIQAKILGQDPALEWVAPPAGTAGERPSVASEEASDEQSAKTHLGAWPMLGRDEELARLVTELDRAASGEAAFAVVTGDPGIGKSRLSAELIDWARRRGMRTVIGRCSQDEGAPPLYPWRGILGALQLDVAVEPGEGSGFAAWEAVVSTLVSEASDEPLLVVLDDLHWADSATLRVLRLLAESARVARLLVVATWRSKPSVTGALADVAEAMARRHAVRIELEGLDESSAAGIVAAVTEREPDSAEAAALCERTDGNPFFLVEYSRLAGTRRDLARLLTEPAPPTAVQEVVARRLDRLPEPTRRALETASVIGRQVEFVVLAASTGGDEDALLDVLDPAYASGLVREVSVDHFSFDHALVRDTLYSQLSPPRRAREHRKVAEVLAGRPDRETEVARHWLAAGSRHAAQAWRAAAAAGDVAMRAHAHPEAAALFSNALEALEQDPGSTERDRYDVLLRLAVALRWAARWDDLTTTAQEAVAIAEGLGDVVLVAEAATLTLRGALWQSARHGHVHESLVVALRRCLEVLPAGDSPLRARCLVTLAGEVYYSSGIEERRALVTESLSMARRIGDRALLLDALLGSYNAVWVPGAESERLAYAEEASELARQLGDAHAEVVAGVQAAVILAELGRPTEMWERYQAALAEAERLRLTYAMIAAQSLVIPWRAMAGDFAECERLYGTLVSLLETSALRHGEEAIGGNVLCLAMWREDFPVPEEVLAALAASTMPTGAVLAYVLWRNGQEERARQWLVESRPDLTPVDWFSMLNWGCAAAMAAFTADSTLGAGAYERLAPHAGQSCGAGSGVASGPVDAFLALGAIATGETTLATRHADEALRLAADWGIPLFTEWFGGQRDRYRF